MLKNKTTWLLIIMVLVVAVIGGLEQKKTAESEVQNGQNQIVVNK